MVKRPRGLNTKEKDFKMATFYNQASISIGGRVTNSNITEGEIVNGLTLTKTAASSTYSAGGGITYIATIVNNGATDSAGLTFTDDLGAYTLPGGARTVTPLTYVDGSVLYYLNGVLQEAPTVTAGPPLTVGGITVPAGGSVTIVYEGLANEFAPLAAGSTIVNTASIDGCEVQTSVATVGTRDEAILSIAKAICPETVTCSGEITYTFIIQNTGNTPVVATDDLILNDTFTPALSGITVNLNGTPLAEGTGYTYDETTGAFATLPGAIPVPAATYVTDPETGVITTTPGVATVTVTGTI